MDESFNFWIRVTAAEFLKSLSRSQQAAHSRTRFLGKRNTFIFLYSLILVYCGRLFCHRELCQKMHRRLGNTPVHMWNVFSLMATDCFSSLRAHWYCEGASRFSEQWLWRLISPGTWCRVRTLKIKATNLSKLKINIYQTTRYHMPEDSNMFFFLAVIVIEFKVT
jgi:hypothetical protein